MTKLMTLSAIALVFSAASGVVPAQDGGDRNRDRTKQHRSSVPAKVGELLESFNLSEKQLARVKQILDTSRQADANWRKENSEDFKDIRDAMSQAKKDSDSAAMKAASERMRKLFASRKGASDNVLIQLSEILGKDQLAKVKSVMSPQRSGPNTYLFRPRILNASLEKLDLTDTRKTEIKKIHDAVNAEMDKARAAMKEAKTNEEKSEIMKGLKQAMTEALDKIKAILGEDLTAKLQQIAGEMAKDEQKQNDPFGGLDLTDGQKEKMSAIRKSVREKMRDAKGSEAKRAIITDMRKEIDAVLTDEQKAKLKEQMDERREAHSQSKRQRDQTDK